jgi:hypothetical protein
MTPFVFFYGCDERAIESFRQEALTVWDDYIERAKDNFTIFFEKGEEFERSVIEGDDLLGAVCGWVRRINDTGSVPVNFKNEKSIMQHCFTT